MRRRAFLTFAAATLAMPARAQDGVMRIRDLYERGGGFTDVAQSQVEQRITLRGYMAPPLRADSSFFVLTARPMATCPFCETAAEWPDDILAVHTKRTVRTVPFNVGIQARGLLELGEWRDPETGFVSLVRLTDATFERA